LQYKLNCSIYSFSSGSEGYDELSSKFTQCLLQMQNPSIYIFYLQFVMLQCGLHLL